MAERRKRAVRLTLFVAFALGLSLAIALILWFDAGRIFALLLGLGWGIVLVALVHAVPIALTMLAWRSLLLACGIDRRLWPLFWMRWVADAVNQLLPVAQIGGEVVRGRLAIQRGAEPAAVAATVIVDTMAGFLSLILFILLGLALLALHGRTSAYMPNFLVGAGLATALVVVLSEAQRRGALSRLAAVLAPVLGARQMRALTGAQALDRKLAALYADPAALIKAVLWRLAGWFGGGLGIWLILHLLGFPVGVIDVLILEAVAQAMRNLGFAIPGALGAQEAGYALGAVAIGLPVEAALAVSLTKRARDLLIGVPALISWQVAEGRILLHR